MPVDLKDYIEVPERIAEFRSKHPDGSLQSEVLSYPSADYPFIVVRAWAYRSPDDPRPGIGHAAEPYPGKTPYTKDSELMNAETSAWGRALVACLAADTKRGIASANEIAARQGSPASPGRTKGKGSTEAQASTTPTGGSEQATPLSLPVGTEGESDSSGGRASASGAALSAPDFIPGVDEQPGEPERERMNRRFHALGAELGLDHAGTKELLGISVSLTTLSDRQLALRIKSLEQMVDREKAKSA